MEFRHPLGLLQSFSSLVRGATTKKRQLPFLFTWQLGEGGYIPTFTKLIKLDMCGIQSAIQTTDWPTSREESKTRLDRKEVRADIRTIGE
jgi:hypothetical protein